MTFLWTARGEPDFFPRSGVPPSSGGSAVAAHRSRWLRVGAKEALRGGSDLGSVFDLRGSCWGLAAFPDFSSSSRTTGVGVRPPSSVRARGEFGPGRSHGAGDIGLRTPLPRELSVMPRPGKENLVFTEVNQRRSTPGPVLAATGRCGAWANRSAIPRRTGRGYSGPPGGVFLPPNILLCSLWKKFEAVPGCFRVPSGAGVSRGWDYPTGAVCAPPSPGVAFPGPGRGGRAGLVCRPLQSACPSALRAPRRPGSPATRGQTWLSHRFLYLPCPPRGFGMLRVPGHTSWPCPLPSIACGSRFPNGKGRR